MGNLHMALRATVLGAASAACLLASDVTWAASECPDVAGHYRVAGFGAALGDALDVLRAQQAGFTDSEVRLSGKPGEGIGVWIKSGGRGSLPSRPNHMLVHGSDFTCSNGQMLFKQAVSASRRSDDGAWLEGNATIQLIPAPNGGLLIHVAFSGRERTTLYSYDSARISLPKPGTGQTLGETVRWPNISEPLPESRTIETPPEPPDVLAVRRLLTRDLLGMVALGWLSQHGDQVKASLKASRSEYAIELEDRLRAASIAYTVKVAPIWSANQYHMELLFDPQSRGKTASWRPSTFRVQHELEKMRYPLVEVREVEAEGADYLATLDLYNDEPIEKILARIRLNTGMFSSIDVVKVVELVHAPRRSGTPVPRIAKLRVRVQQDG